MTIASFVALAAEEAEHHFNIMDTFGYGVVCFVVFLLLGLVTLSYRNVSNRHSRKADQYAKTYAHELQQTGHGHH